jgi:DNA-directed RNA polymerase specialized sigma24 family protein
LASVSESLVRLPSRFSAPLAAFDEDLLDLDEAVKHLEVLDPRADSVVELRYFDGLTETESAEMIGVSVATLKRDWDFARAWLIRRLEPR